MTARKAGSSRHVWATIKIAFPGHYVLDVLTGDDGPSEPIKYPVVAWALEEGTLAPYPVTLEGVQLDAHILQPDGSIECACVGGYPNIEEWFADQRETYTRGKRGRDASAT